MELKLPQLNESRHCKKAARRNALTSTLPKLPPVVNKVLLPRPPCSTTILDYCVHPLPRLADTKFATNRSTPHPKGLAFQSAYNRNNQVSDSIMQRLCKEFYFASDLWNLESRTKVLSP